MKKQYLFGILAILLASCGNTNVSNSSSDSSTSSESSEVLESSSTSYIPPDSKPSVEVDENLKVHYEYINTYNDLLYIKYDFEYKVFNSKEELESFYKELETNIKNLEGNTKESCKDEIINYNFDVGSIVLVTGNYKYSGTYAFEISSAKLDNDTLTVTGCIDYSNIPIPLNNIGLAFIEVNSKNVTEVIKDISTYNVNPAQPGMVYKPIIYLYPTEEIDLTIKFTNYENLLTTYPKYDNGWDIHVSVDGTITDKNNKEYYALYYDEVRSYTCDFSEGFYVYKDDAISFLEEKLDYIGLTSREANEFIMYWLPILEENVHSLVYFELTDSRNTYSPLELSITPDSELRVNIHILKVDSKINIKEQKLERFERQGFTLVEWGGTNY